MLNSLGGIALVAVFYAMTLLTVVMYNRWLKAAKTESNYIEEIPCGRDKWD